MTDKPLKLIVGGPKTGKTTLAGKDATHTDDLGTDRKGWDERIDTIAAQIRGGKGTIEGAVVPHALRRVLRDDPNARFDHLSVEVLNKPYGATSKGQQAMAKGIRSVWDEIAPQLRQRGATIREW